MTGASAVKRAASAPELPRFRAPIVFGFLLLLFLVLIGRSHQRGLRRLLGRTADIRLVREAEDLDVQVVALGETRE